LHHLLTHTSGLPALMCDDVKEKISRDEAEKRILQAKMTGEPGKQFSYSNIAYVMAAIVIEKVSGMAYENFLFENLFKPAGMLNTGYVLPKFDKSNVSSGFVEDSITAVKPMALNWMDDGLTWRLRGAGGLLTTTGDLYKWQKALWSAKIISKENLDTLQSPHVKPGAIKTMPRAGYGYGWFIRPTPRNTTIIEHGGNIGSFSSDFRYYPEEKILIVLSGNSSKLTPRQLLQPISNILLESL
jgi:CubicO group peptidase (beta-lactamase class C family)